MDPLFKAAVDYAIRSWRIKNPQDVSEERSRNTDKSSILAKADGVALAQELPIGKHLTFFDERQVEVHLPDHLSHGALVTVNRLGEQRDGRADPKAGLQVRTRLSPAGGTCQALSPSASSFLPSALSSLACSVDSTGCKVDSSSP